LVSDNLATVAAVPAWLPTFLFLSATLSISAGSLAEFTSGLTGPEKAHPEEEQGTLEVQWRMRQAFLEDCRVLEE